MLFSKIKIGIVTRYNYLIGLLPVKLANRLIWVDRQMDCSAISAEAQANNTKVQELPAEIRVRTSTTALRPSTRT